MNLCIVYAWTALKWFMPFTHKRHKPCMHEVPHVKTVDDIFLREMGGKISGGAPRPLWLRAQISVSRELSYGCHRLYSIDSGRKREEPMKGEVQSDGGSDGGVLGWLKEKIFGWWRLELGTKTIIRIRYWKYHHIKPCHSVNCACVVITQLLFPVYR